MAQSQIPSPPDVAWLDEDQLAAWRSLATMLEKLRWALECQLSRDAGLSFLEYHVLARLSEEPAHTLRMSELAFRNSASLSRLSHLVSRLESRGLVRREPDLTDRRATNAVLTDDGYAKLVASAPAHVVAVRELVIDEFTALELERLYDATGRIISRVEKSAWDQELA